jgi:hypothetical protein
MVHPCMDHLAPDERPSTGLMGIGANGSVNTAGEFGDIFRALARQPTTPRPIDCQDVLDNLVP